MTLKRTTDRLPRARYGERVEFAQGERETDHDRETEQWAAEVFEDLELLDDSGPDEPDEPEDDYEPPERDGSDDERSIEDEAARVVNEMENEHPR